MIIMVLCAAIIVAGGVFVYAVRKKSLIQETFQRLVATRNMKERQIETYFNFIKNQCLILAEDPTVVTACKEFQDATKSIEGQSKAEDVRALEDKDSLTEYYKNEFIKRLNINLEIPQTVENYIPDDATGKVLQNLYIAKNSNPVGQKDLLDDAGDGSAYSTVHKKYHAFFRSFLKKFKYYDIFIIDLESRVVYSVFKEIDYASLLDRKGLKDSNLNNLIKRVLVLGAKDSTHFVDFAPYDPSYAAPAGFVASPIYDADRKIGIIAMQFPLDSITSIMTDDNHWIQSGFGVTGETYLVGKDYKMRSIARLLVETPERYFKKLEQLGTPLKIIDRIRVYKTSVFLQEITTEPVREIVRGETGTMISTDYLGNKVLSAYAPIALDGLQWGIECKIDESEAVTPVRTTLYWYLGLGLLLLVALSIFVAAMIRSMFHSAAPILSNVTLLKQHTIAIQESIDEYARIAGDETLPNMRSFANNLEDVSSGVQRSVSELLRVEHTLQEALSTTDALYQKLLQEYAEDENKGKELKDVIFNQLSLIQSMRRSTDQLQYAISRGIELTEHDQTLSAALKKNFEDQAQVVKDFDNALLKSAEQSQRITDFDQKQSSHNQTIDALLGQVSQQFGSFKELAHTLTAVRERNQELSPKFLALVNTGRQVVDGYEAAVDHYKKAAPIFEKIHHSLEEINTLLKG